MLSHHVDEVVCRWCGHGRSVVEIIDRGRRSRARRRRCRDRAAAGRAPAPARPIPTYRDHPATTPARRRRRRPRRRAGPHRCRARRPTRSCSSSSRRAASAAATCGRAWPSCGPASPAALRLAVVTKGPDAGGRRRHRRPGRPTSGHAVVMSSQAFADYRVGGPPFLVVVDAERVRDRGRGLGRGGDAAEPPWRRLEPR